MHRTVICEYRGDYCGVAMTMHSDRVRRDVLGEELAELSRQRGLVESTDRNYRKLQSGESTGVAFGD
jgi:hypothetical protein